MSRCPQCGESVSQFAAGCAICGFDLEAARARRKRRTVAYQLPRVNEDLLWIAVVALIVASMPWLGLALAIYGVVAANLTSQAATRTALVVLAVAAFALIAMPATRYGVWWMLGS